MASIPTLNAESVSGSLMSPGHDLRLTCFLCGTPNRNIATSGLRTVRAGWLFVESFCKATPRLRQAHACAPWALRSSMTLYHRHLDVVQCFGLCDDSAHMTDVTATRFVH